MINIRKRNNLYEYRFEAGKVNGKRKQISKSGFKTKREAYLAGQKAYEEFIGGESTKQCNMLYSEDLDYWMKEYFEINYKYSTAKRYKESFYNILYLSHFENKEINIQYILNKIKNYLFRLNIEVLEQEHIGVQVYQNSKIGEGYYCEVFKITDGIVKKKLKKEHLSNFLYLICIQN